MSGIDFSTICNHTRLKRINQNFVRCLECGLSMISHVKIPINKKERDFVKENKSFIRNFDRNFSNTLEEVDDSVIKPLYEYYMDKRGVNRIIVNRMIQFNSNPPKYEVIVNGHKYYLVEESIIKMLSDIGAIRVDRELFNRKF